MQSPYALGNDALYRRWRAWKLENYPVRTESVVVEVRDPRNPSPIEMQELLRVCRKANMAIYRSRLGGDIDKDIPGDSERILGSTTSTVTCSRTRTASPRSRSCRASPGGGTFRTRTADCCGTPTVTTIQRPIASARFCCTVFSRPRKEERTRCSTPEIAYIRLRDADPDYAHALMAPDAMTIPPNTEAGAERPASIGPVFAIDSMSGNLHMRYTARVRSILWKDDATTVAAVRFLEQLLADDSSSVFRYRLAAGEGLLCNNVLHNRTAFSDKEQRGARRLLYRARYYDRIVGTNVSEIFGS